MPIKVDWGSHGLAYTPPDFLKDGAARCECGWMSAKTTPNRAHAAWLAHARRALSKRGNR